ncbi:tRNA (guanine(46)-N(7))-methyltransferase TrmB [Lacimicrobium alkaliphilum]|uniref:tRNA (guanine(46)-N(7))-methyltransferase n=1 Tax=Lacimicrobium alkaliphilum TaxID=1526571 RepID=A0A0U3AT11_9ALTE|nr:SAM-dependent methyltransferase [Lacimicrobium alkaliphilum]ALS97231.1 SAM-dependent methyltransferase [Lacimicrobium alkaliphilum]
MMSANSRVVTSNQTGPHKKLPELVKRHLAMPSRKPFSEHTLAAFEQAQSWLDDWSGPLIMDSCCGVGESTAVIAGLYPEARVIGVDKSALRTEKHQRGYAAEQPNYLVLRADLNDFWRLAHQAGWRLNKHYLLYPNPWPKSVHIKRRWHGGAAFADILKLGGELIVRSNWALYVEEFALALQIAGVEAKPHLYHSEQAMTPFERKYRASGQQSWQLVADLGRRWGSD